VSGRLVSWIREFRVHFARVQHNHMRLKQASSPTQLSAKIPSVQVFCGGPPANLPSIVGKPVATCSRGPTPTVFHCAPLSNLANSRAFLIQIAGKTCVPTPRSFSSKPDSAGPQLQTLPSAKAGHSAARVGWLPLAASLQARMTKRRPGHVGPQQQQASVDRIFVAAGPHWPPKTGGEDGRIWWIPCGDCAACPLLGTSRRSVFQSEPLPPHLSSSAPTRLTHFCQFIRIAAGSGFATNFGTNFMI
jgi:hypothetical protein